ncbi:MAG: dipeptidase PepE [Bacteroidota bacterium]
MTLLLLSNSSSDAGFLTHASGWIADTLGDATRIVFVPFADATGSYDGYTARVAEALGSLDVEVTGIHAASDPLLAVSEADAVLVGGGNTFKLVHECAERLLLSAIWHRVSQGAPYVGWSAGANLACPTIRTTNDMPIVEPASLDALGLVPVQINPHYTDAHPPGHRGETRADRLREFVIANPGIPVVGLPEGTGVRVRGTDAEILGAGDIRLFDDASPAGRVVTPTDAAALFAG